MSFFESSRKLNRDLEKTGGDGQTSTPTITINDGFKVKPGQQVKLHGQGAGTILKADGSAYKKPKTSDELVAEATQEAEEFSNANKSKVEKAYKSFNWIGNWGIVAIIIAGCTMGISYAFQHKAFTDPALDWLNWVWAISTSIGLIVGAWFLKTAYDGLKAGAFNGIDKFVVVAMMVWVFLDELGGGFVRFNQDFAQFYFMIFAPLTGPVVVLVAKSMELLNTKKRRSRVLSSIEEKRKHAEAMSRQQAPLDKIKSEEKARLMGSLATKIHRMKVSVIASLYGTFWGWGEAKDQAVAQVEARRKEVGKHIEGYKPKGTKKTTKK